VAALVEERTAAAQRRNHRTGRLADAMGVFQRPHDTAGGASRIGPGVGNLAQLQAARRSSGNATVFLFGKSSHTSVAPPLAEITSGVSAMDSVK
jgi:hypothetical protein